MFLLQGQFLHDMYHGDGKMQHSSGMLYIGQWLHGFPTRLASKLVLVVEESPLLIRQGQPFKIGVKCVDDDDNEVVEGESKLKELHVDHNVDILLVNDYFCICSSCSHDWKNDDQQNIDMGSPTCTKS